MVHHNFVHLFSFFFLNFCYSASVSSILLSFIAEFEVKSIRLVVLCHFKRAFLTVLGTLVSSNFDFMPKLYSTADRILHYILG